MGVPGTTVRRFHPPPSPIPPLEQGDQLTREEFEQRYEAMPELKKAELIEGLVQYTLVGPLESTCGSARRLDRLVGSLPGFYSWS